MKSLFMLGRQPAISRVELESRFGADKVVDQNQHVAAGAAHPTRTMIDSLGGTTKIARLLSSSPKTNWSDIEEYLMQTLPLQLKDYPEGKIKLGCSVYGIRVPIKQIEKTLLRIKKKLRADGKSIRIIPNKDLELSTAQVIHNKLTAEKGFELIISKSEQDGLVHFGQTVAVQDIEAYAARDQARPMRDAKVGMLPPKLAQIIINLAAGQQNSHRSVDAPGSSDERQRRTSSTSIERESVSDKVMRQEPRHMPSSAWQSDEVPIVVLDPFCGTGVILQEATLMNYGVIGSDIDERMVEYSQKNLAWLNDIGDGISSNYIEQNNITILQADATNATWDSRFDAIAAETYLGRPFSALPDGKTLQKVMQDVDTIHRKFLRNIAKQTKPGFRMCIAVPAWRIHNSFRHLKVLESLDELGYNRVSFVHADDSELIYHREGQIVGRELVVLTRT